MTVKIFSRTVLFLSVFCVASLAAQVIDPVVLYPYLSVTPASPVAGKDSVNLQLALGSAGNACMAPTFTGLSFTVQQSPLAIYPPVYNVNLSYTLVPVPPGKMCPMIYAPVDYGPSFALGKLALGSYTVTDQTTKMQVGSLSVTSVQQALKDTVYVTPLKPTTKDSLHFDLFNANLECCTPYYDKNVVITDSVITLSFQYTNINTCACLVAGSHTPFACGPQKAGKYAIYKEQSVFCATPPCPLVAGPIQLVRVGQVVVGGTSVSRSLPTAPNAGGLAVRQERNTVFMEYVLDQPSYVRLNVFNARGMLAGQLYNGESSAGRHEFSWKAAAQGVYVMTAEINGAAAMTRKVIMSR